MRLLLRFAPSVLALVSYGLVSCMLSGCGSPPEAPEPEPRPPVDRPLRVLLLGDSISMGYTPFVREALAEEAVVVRPHRNGRPENCEGTTKGVRAVDRWLALEPGQWDVIHVNFGLHDLKRVDADTGRNSNDPSDPPQAATELYEQQLTEILDRLLASGAEVVLATTTPVPGGTLRPHREPEDAVRYNEIARRVAGRAGVQVNDLHAFVLAQEPPILREGDVHFDARGSQLLGERVAAVVLALALGEAPPGNR